MQMQAHACRCMHVRPGSLAGVNRTAELLKAGGGGRTSFIYESEGGPRDWPNTKRKVGVLSASGLMESSITGGGRTQASNALIYHAM